MKRLIDKLFILPTQSTSLQLFRYGFVGGVAFVADYGTLYVCTDFFYIHHLVSAALAFVVGLTINYTLSVLWVFAQHSQSNRWAEFFVFAIIGVIGLGLNESIIYLCTDVCGIHYMLSKLFSTVVVFFWNFFVRKFVLF